jgi:dihydroorotase
MFQILLKGGLLIDPSQGIHKKGSVAIQDGKIIQVGEDSSEAKAEKVFNMEGKIIAPGLIDIHCHPAAGFSRLGVPADEIGLNSGVTLLCDGGTSGAANFEALRLFIVEPAKTDIFCFLNLSNAGLITLPEIWCEQNIDLDSSKQVIEANVDIIKGVKIRAVQSLADGLGIQGIELAKKLAKDVNLPLMMHVGETRSRIPGDKMDDFSRASVSLLEQGDILSHYLTWEPGGMILKDGTVYPELEAARKRGVVLDSCHGLNHFSFTIARHAIAKGLIPTVISTDMASMVLPTAQSLAVVMSKFINMGLSVDQVVEMTTINPAKALGEEKKRGSLTPGMSADITVMELMQGDYTFCDGTGGEVIHGEVLLEPRMVFKAGEGLPAYSRYHIPPLYT